MDMVKLIIKMIITSLIESIKLLFTLSNYYNVSPITYIIIKIEI